MFRRQPLSQPAMFINVSHAKETSFCLYFLSAAFNLCVCVCGIKQPWIIFHFAGVFSACKEGNLTELKNILPYVPEAINEVVNEEGDNLLMW